MIAVRKTGHTHWAIEKEEVVVVVVVVGGGAAAVDNLCM